MAAKSTEKNGASKTPSHEDLRRVIDEAEQVLAREAAQQGRREEGASGNPSVSEGPKARGRTRAREGAVTAAGLAGGETARRAVKDAVGLKEVVEVAKRVGSRQTKGMTDEQVLRWLAEKPGRLRTLGGHLFEHLDSKDLERLSKMTGGKTPVLKLYGAHNRPGLDGAYQGVRKAGGARFAQHKLSENEQLLKKAAEKTNARVRGKTELVVGRGTKVKPSTTEGLKGARQAGRSVKDVNGMIQTAADPSKVTKAGTQAAQKLTLRASGGAVALGAGISVACDIKGLVEGEKTVGEAAENAAWAAGEAALCTAGTAAVTAGAAPTIAAGTAFLAGSAATGTTAMAAGLATLGPIGLGVGVGIGIGWGVKKVRAKTRG